MSDDELYWSDFQESLREVTDEDMAAAYGHKLTHVCKGRKDDSCKGCSKTIVKGATHFVRYEGVSTSKLVEYRKHLWCTTDQDACCDKAQDQLEERGFGLTFANEVQAGAQ